MLTDELPNNPEFLVEGNIDALPLKSLFLCVPVAECVISGLVDPVKSEVKPEPLNPE